MRLSLSLFIVTAWVAVSGAAAQTAARQPSANQPVANQPAAAEPAVSQPAAAQSAVARHPRARRVKGTAQRSETASASAGVALGATDITGNKELPKVMVIVPWKDSLGAGGVIKPADSLLDQVLQPVDRGVFQRQIHYYGQLNAAEQRRTAAKVAPVGDSP